MVALGDGIFHPEHPNSLQKVTKSLLSNLWVKGTFLTPFYGALTVITGPLMVLGLLAIDIFAPLVHERVKICFFMHFSDSMCTQPSDVNIK